MYLGYVVFDSYIQLGPQLIHDLLEDGPKRHAQLAVGCRDAFIEPASLFLCTRLLERHLLFDLAYFLVQGLHVETQIAKISLKLLYLSGG
jgi:hypothetical protein